MSRKTRLTKQAFKQAQREKRNKSRVKSEKIPPMPLSQIVPEPDFVELLTRKTTGKRNVTSPRSKPLNYTSLVVTTNRGTAQSRKNVTKPHYTHKTGARHRMLVVTEQYRTHNLAERFEKFLDITREKPYKIMPPTHKPIPQIVLYRHAGWTMIEPSEISPATTRERK